MHHFTTAVIAVFCSLVTVVGFNAYKESKTLPTIGVVSISDIIAEHTNAMTEKDFSVEQASISGEQFAEKLEEALAFVEQTDGVTLIVKEAVISGATDYTDTIRQMTLMEN